MTASLHSGIKNNAYKHTWTKDDLRLLFSICKMAPNDDVCKKELLEVHFPQCTPGAIHIAVSIRYAELNGHNSSWFASNIPKKWREVWAERDWHRI